MLVSLIALGFGASTLPVGLGFSAFGTGASFLLLVAVLVALFVVALVVLFAYRCYDID